MARYLETVRQLHKEVKALMEQSIIPKCKSKEEMDAIAVRLGHIVNLAVRCNPRQAQGTVRENIVAGAMRGYCQVAMILETDKRTGREYNKIQIQ